MKPGQETPTFIPEWPAPGNVRACFTTRHGGFSTGPWASANLATHVGDQLSAVTQNRERLTRSLALEQQPCWLNQVHGTHIHRLDQCTYGVTADGAITNRSGVACVVMVADCLPVLLCAGDGREVAAVHAGWRGLASGILGQAVAQFDSPPEQLIAWLGPCIGAGNYPVGFELRTTFISEHAAYEACFVEHAGRVHMNLRELAKQQLKRLGVTAVNVSERCVYAEDDSFFSFRRDGTTGRMAALIWIS